MNIGHTSNSNSGVVVTVCEGAVTIGELAAYAGCLFENPEFSKFTKHMVDLRLARVDAFRVGESRELAQLCGPESSKTARRIAIVAGREFSNAKHLENHVQPGATCAITFNNLDTACAWLGIDPVEAEEAVHAIRLHLHDDNHSLSGLSGEAVSGLNYFETQSMPPPQKSEGAIS